MKIGLNKIFLISSIVLPIALVVISLLLIYIPSLLIQPKHDYIFAVHTSCDECEKGEKYITSAKVNLDGRIKFVEDTFSPTGDIYYRESFQIANFYKYDISTNEYEKISNEDLRKLNLSSSLKSPDGFEFRQDYTSGFFGSSNGDFILEGNASRKKQNLDAFSNYEYRLEFISWIL